MRQKKVDGIVNINKPVGWSSYETVRVLKELSGASKAGHAGTLDPDAKGVLIILLGEACKVSSIFMNQDKEYEAEIMLGYQSTTLDATGEIEKCRSEVESLKKDVLKKQLSSFKGIYRHKVPDYSAKKYKSKPFYKIKREGKTPPLRFQESVIKSINFIEYNEPLLKFSVTCTSGTYIRSLAVDIAKKLGTSAYLDKLIRTKTGKFSVQDAMPPAEEKWKNAFIDLSIALQKFSYVVIDKESSEKLISGTVFKRKNIIDTKGDIEVGVFGVYSYEKKVLAIAENNENSFKIKRVFKV